jgi:transcriptional regulator of acetoin/glycerol metabolism
VGTLNPYFYAYNPELLAFENAWVNFAKGMEVNQKVIKKEIADSWRRCRDSGLDPLDRKILPLLGDKELKNRIQRNQTLYDVVRPFTEALYGIVQGSGFRVDLVDSEGYVLSSIGDEETMEICKKTNSFPGANRSEDISGTNAISLALITKKPVQVAGAEHYLQKFHIWACSAAPILDSAGTVLGALNMAGRYELVHQHTLGMVVAIAKAIENELHILKINEQLIENNSQLSETLSFITDGIVYVRKGRIEQANKKICNLLGCSSDYIIGKGVADVIRTSPDLQKILSAEDKEYQNAEIVLEGKQRKYRCLFDISTVHGKEKQEVGKIMVFTQVEEIQMLVKRIKYIAKYSFDDIIGQSPDLLRAVDIARKASRHNTRIIIEGESGTGKEMIAQAIHNESRRRYDPFVAVDCGAIPHDLLESELFGYEGGAFTGAKKEGKLGLVELADKGTILLDEIGNMPMEMQIKMLRFLQEGVINRVGGTHPIRVDVRVIAATNANLEEAVENGTFRRDLFYRLNVFHIKVPPLRERTEDIRILVEHFIGDYCGSDRKIQIENAVILALGRYDWPGNIRQLHNVIERALIMSKGSRITIEDLPLEIIQEGETFSVSNNFSLERVMPLNVAMKKYLEMVLANCNHNVSKTAKALGITRATVYKLLKSEDN